MTSPRGSASYKKRDGTISISNDRQLVHWAPVAPPESKPALTIPVTSITSGLRCIAVQSFKHSLLNCISDLQQTPATSAKVMLKIFVQGASTTETHVFSFTSPKARAEADAIKNVLSTSIQIAKSGSNVVAHAHQNAGGSAVSDVPPWYNDDRLMSDVELQQSLLKVNGPLSKTFVESLRIKPDSITNSQFTSQFWSSRLQLLRAHAIEKKQTRGAYNVLSSIKPVTVDNAIRLTISKEQIQLIFDQHSLVKLVYDENVPRLSEETFWSRFFQSRLFKKLKGEKISEADPIDQVLDKYLQYDDDAERGQRLLASHVPHIIDVEGNEENHSQRKGNQPDFTMRPTSMDRVPIIRTLNALSQKIMAHVPPHDVDPSLPIGVDEATYNSLALRDLQAEAKGSSIPLNIKDQSAFFSSSKESGVSADAAHYAQLDPEKVLESLQADLDTFIANPKLENFLGLDNNSDSSDDESASKKPHVGSKASIEAATRQMLDIITQQRTQSEPSHSSSAQSQSSETRGLSQALFDRHTLTHATTSEFLKQFWSAFLSGDATRADELAGLVETLDRCMDRIQAVADDADAERSREVARLRKQVADHYNRTQRRLRLDPDKVQGGATAVLGLLASTINQIRVATRRYRDALVAAGVEGEGEGDEEMAS